MELIENYDLDCVYDMCKLVKTLFVYFAILVRIKIKY